MTTIDLSKDEVVAKNKEGAVVLAEGAVTGHKHQFKEKEVTMYIHKDKLKGTRETRLEIKGNGAVLVHEEHSLHTFSPGIGEVRRQSEYQMGELRRAAD